MRQFMGVGSLIKPSLFEQQLTLTWIEKIYELVDGSKITHDRMLRSIFATLAYELTYATSQGPYMNFWLQKMDPEFKFVGATISSPKLQERIGKKHGGHGLMLAYIKSDDANDMSRHLELTDFAGSMSIFHGVCNARQARQVEVVSENIRSQFSNTLPPTATILGLSKLLVSQVVRPTQKGQNIETAGERSSLSDGAGSFSLFAGSFQGGVLYGERAGRSPAHYSTWISSGAYATVYGGLRGAVLKHSMNHSIIKGMGSDI